MNLGVVLLIILICVLLGVIPMHSYSNSWGYAPGGGVGLLILIVIILLVMKVL